MAGFERDVMLAQNMNFDPAAPKPHVGIINAAGKFPIGTGNLSPIPEILGGSLTSPNNSITFGYSSPNITAQVNTSVVTDLHTSRFIVSAGGLTNGANYTTIASAYAAASAGDTIFIQSASTPYVENISLTKSGVNLSAFGCDGIAGDTNAPNVIIQGTLTASYSGSASISGIQLKTNGSAALATTGSNTGTLNLINCGMDGSNATAMTLNNPNFTVAFMNSKLMTESNNLLYAVTSGNITFRNCAAQAGTGANTIASGVINMFNSVFSAYSLTTSSTGSFSAYNSFFTNPNQTIFTLAGTGTGIIEECSLASGTASTVSIGSGCTLQIDDCAINSSNTNVLTGAGTLNVGSLVFTGSSSGINVTTINGFIEQHGPTLRGTASVTLVPMASTTGTGGAALLIGADTSNSGSAGGTGTVQGGAGNGAGAGGNGRVLGGTAGATGNGGSVVLLAANGGATSGTGGTIAITGGTATGTNTNSREMIITNAVGTGTGTTGHINLLCDAQGGTSGSTAHTSVPRMVLNGYTALTSGIGAVLMTATLPTNGNAGGQLFYSIEATNGTDYQTVSGIVAWAFTSKAGTIAGSASVLGSEAKSLTTGTLNTAWAANNAGGVQVTATSSITPTSMRVVYQVFSGSQQTISVN